MMKMMSMRMMTETGTIGSLIDNITENHRIYLYGVIFLRKKIRREASFVVSNLPLIGVFAFLSSIGGVLLWVNGGSAWYIMQSMRNRESLSLGGAFILWLFVYALIGAVMAIIFKAGKSCSTPSKSQFIAFCLISAVYILTLAWYAVFFCTRLMLFSAILLMISIFLCAVVFIIMRKALLLLNLFIVLIESAQIYFLYLNISIYLSN